jgi:hypothetical protein
MIVADSSLSLASQHLAIKQYQKKESLKMWSGAQRPNFEGNAKNDTVTLSGKQPATEAAKAGRSNSSEELDSKLLLLQSLLETLTGKKVTIAELKKIVTGVTEGDAQATPESQISEQAAPQKKHPDHVAPQSQQPARAGYGIEYDASEIRYEAEQTSFSAGGVIKTADGKEISFTIGLTMSREYLSQTTTSLRVGDAATKDPLVINFNGMAAELTDTKFTFDIDADGTAEHIASLGSGSGYLALDRNQDGTINNGTELFGARTGNGFSELAAYDQNRDNWIDEQDAVFGQLQIWQGGSGGLTSLKDAGVGAISLASQQTPFSLKDSGNQLLGEVKATGVYVKENGSVGTVQQLDLAV